MVDDTVRESIAEALTSWDQAAAAKRSQEAEQLRVQFVERFPVDAWPTMPLTDYALGQETQDTVSYWLEYKTGVIGSIKGGSSFKHLIFRSRDDGTWRFPKSYESQHAAWPAIRSGFVDILRLAADGDFDDVDDVAVLNGAPAVRTTIKSAEPGPLPGLPDLHRGVAQYPGPLGRGDAADRDPERLCGMGDLAGC